MTENITLPREVVEEALEALELEATSPPLETTAAAMAALRAYLAAEPTKPEPVAWMDRFGSVVLGKGPYETFTTPLYTFPPDAPTVKESLTHPGYIIGSHWLETAYSRVCAGEAEADVLRDIGLVRITDGMVETADIHAIVDRQEALRRDAERWRHWRDSHGFATIDHEGGRCFVTLICDCDDPDQVRAKRFRGEDSFEWLDAFTDAAMEDKT